MKNDFQNASIKNFECSPFGRPNEPGVYAVLIRNYSSESGESHIIYIGSSKNIRKRVDVGRGHYYRKVYERFPDKIVFVKFFVTDNYKNIEKYMIKKYKPTLNKRGL